ncbi:MAG: hypothetical protein AB7T20_02370 [Steroidobacteraceae bacterium]
MTGAIWKALAFGMVLAGSIGPIALLIFGTAARRGFAAGCFAGLGAALADLVYALLAFSIGALLLPVFLLTLVNPMTIVVFAGFVPQLPLAGSLPAAVTLAIALAAGSYAVAFAVAAAGAVLGRALPGRGWQRAINLAAAAGILAFGLTGLLAAI